MAEATRESDGAHKTHLLHLQLTFDVEVSLLSSSSVWFSSSEAKKCWSECAKLLINSFNLHSHSNPEDFFFAGLRPVSSPRRKLVQQELIGDSS